MPRGVYIGWIVIDPAVEWKIRNRTGGGCTPDEVREAFQGRDDAEVEARPGTNPLEVSGFGETAHGRRLFAALIALDEADGTWVLKSSWPV